MDFTTIPPEFNDRFKQGCSYVLPIFLGYQAPGSTAPPAPVPLVNATATWNFYDIEGKTTLALASPTGLQIDGIQGTITATITAAQSAALPAGRLNHSLVVVHFNGPSVEYLVGVMQVDMVNSAY